MNNRNPKALADYPPPNTSPVERQLLADMAGNPDTIAEVDSIVTPEMFSGEDRKAIYETMLSMFYKEERIDYSTLFGKMGQRFIDEVINGGAQMGATATDTINHADALRSADTRRRAYQAAVSLLNLAILPGVTEETIFAEAESISTSLQGMQRMKEESTMPEVVNAVAEEVQQREILRKSGKTVRIPTGFPSLDRLTFQGWGPGQLVILAARPSVGKTAVMLQMARASAGAGFQTAIFSLEMTKEELGQRMLYSTGKVSPTHIALGYSDEDRMYFWRDFEEASRYISGLPITINDSARQLQTITSKIHVLARKGKCRIAFIDYLSLVKDNENAKIPLYQQIGNITGALKAAAKDAKIPVVLLCQLNRASASEDRPPQLFDLRDSGSVEQDADIVVMLESAKDGGGLNMYLRKNRQYRKEVCINLRPNDTYTQFEEIGMQE